MNVAEHSNLEVAERHSEDERRDAYSGAPPPLLTAEIVQSLSILDL